jgi:8-oxo-dGTP diphosphatase
MVTVDAVVFTVRDGVLEVLLVERGKEPFAGMRALPGGFIDPDEALETAVARELEEETGLADLHLEQFHTFGDPGRDPRGRTISVAYMALANWEWYKPRPGDDAAGAGWVPVESLPGLAFDHSRIIDVARNNLRTHLRHAGVGMQLLPEMFTIEALREVYEAIQGVHIDASAFRYDLVERRIIEPVEVADGGDARPDEELYRFRPESVLFF